MNFETNVQELCPLLQLSLLSSASTFPADDMELYHSIPGKDAELPKVLLAGEDVQDDREASTSTAFSHSLSVKYNDSGLFNETRGNHQEK